MPDDEYPQAREGEHVAPAFEKKIERLRRQQDARLMDVRASLDGGLEECAAGGHRLEP